MAYASNITNPSAQQPGLRAFIVFDEVPTGYILHEVQDDRMAPFLSRGDVAVIDTREADPIHGELSLIEWQSGRQQIIEVGRFDRPENIEGWDGQSEYWCAFWRMELLSFDCERANHARWFDGPYPEAAFAEKLLGTVVGIYEPRQARLAA